jgi:lipoprotein-releasing system permease protein
MHRFVEIFLALRYLRPKRSFVSIITVLSLLGVMFGVMVLIVVLAVMEGFERELHEKIVGFNAHVTITNQEGVFSQWREVSELVQKDPEVLAVAPFVFGPVLAQYTNKITTPYIKGIDLVESEKVQPIKNALMVGEWLSGPDSILVGQEWARQYDAWVGDVITIQSPRNMRNLLPPEQGQESEKSFYLPAEYKIVGIFSTGYYEYDYNFMLVELGEAQRLYDLGESVQGLSLRVKDPLQATRVKERLNDQLQLPLRARTWIDENKIRFAAIATERKVMSFILFFVMIVASFGLTSTLITVTVQKSREIGLLKALGARDLQIMVIFTLYGFVVGVLGAILGTAGGLALLIYRNPFSELLYRLFQVEVFPSEIYGFAAIPAVIEPTTVTLIACSGVLLSTLAALLPAFSAMRIDPVKVLHNE